MFIFVWMICIGQVRKGIFLELVHPLFDHNSTGNSMFKGVVRSKSVIYQIKKSTDGEILEIYSLELKGILSRLPRLDSRDEVELTCKEQKGMFLRNTSPPRNNRLIQ